MKLLSMRFEDFIWPYNPRSFEATMKRRIAVHKVPFGKDILQNMGREHRVFRGEGEFAGSGAYGVYKRLEKYFVNGGSGVMYHPVWGAHQVIFAALSLQQEPMENYVRYSFEFWEDDFDEEVPKNLKNGTENKKKIVYTVVGGDTLWGIAAKANKSIAEIVEKNPQIKNINAINVGDKVYL